MYWAVGYSGPLMTTAGQARVRTFIPVEARDTLQELATSDSRYLAGEITRACIYYAAHPELATRTIDELMKPADPGLRIADRIAEAVLRHEREADGEDDLPGSDRDG